MASMRRLVADQSSLRRSGLPPNYLFPDDGASMPDDLTQLTVLLTGANGTPYSQGLWRLHLRMPEDYPKNPPKATFKTRIFHPNVEENTGAVCVETLKRDWDSKLTLRDVLVTISCLLIQPNPDSALNSTAGSLLQEDYEAFARQAKLMTSIHAPVPQSLKKAVQEAKLRGEDADMLKKYAEENNQSSTSSSSSSRAASTSSSSIIMKKAINNSASQLAAGNASEPIEDEEEEEIHDPSKENDPSLSPSPVTPPGPLSPRKSTLGKRPLSALPTPVDPDDGDYDDDEAGMTASERNISANATPFTASCDQNDTETPLRKSPKLIDIGGKGVNASGRVRELSGVESKPFRGETEDEKENLGKSKSELSSANSSVTSQSSTSMLEAISTKPTVSRPTIRKPTTGNASTNSKNNKARIGIRRL